MKHPIDVRPGDRVSVEGYSGEGYWCTGIYSIDAIAGTIVLLKNKDCGTTYRLSFRNIVAIMECGEGNHEWSNPGGSVPGCLRCFKKYSTPEPKIGDWRCRRHQPRGERDCCIPKCGFREVYRSTGWVCDARTKIGPRDRRHGAPREYRDGELVDFRIPCIIRMAAGAPIMHPNGVPVCFPEPVTSFKSYVTFIERRGRMTDRRKA